MLKKLQLLDQSPISDIDQYFLLPLVSVSDTKTPGWLCKWWRTYKDEYPQMAAAARDYLAIPATEVSVERVFSEARGAIQDNRHSLKGDTIRILMLSHDGYKC